jgi:hypothetical protein
MVLLVLLAIGVSAQAALVPNGDFKMYKPGTGYTVRATFPEGNIWTTGMGDNAPINGSLEAIYADGTTGKAVDVPGWITPITLPAWRDGADHTTGTCDLFTLGYDETDGTSCLNAFGTWSGQNGNLAMSADPLTLPGSGPITISAMVIGDVGPRTFELLVNGVALVPDSVVEPTYIQEWQEMSRTYNSVPAGDVRILVGTKPPHTTAEDDPDRLFGTRMRVDNITLVPEPATMLLLGLGGFGLVRRRRR